MEVCSLKFGHTFKENLKFFLKNPKQLKTITENCLKTINIILSTYTLRYVLEKKLKYFWKKHFSFIFFPNFSQFSKFQWDNDDGDDDGQLCDPKLTETIANQGKIWNRPSCPPFAHRRTAWGYPKSGTTRKALFWHIFQFWLLGGPKCDQNQSSHVNIMSKLH